MKLPLLLCFILLCQKATAQTADSVLKVVFKYAKGHNSWGQTGVYSREEIIEMEPDGRAGFRLKKYYRVTKTDDSVTKVSKSDTTIVRSHLHVSKSEIDLLYQQLNTPKDNWNMAFIKPWLKKPTKRDILKMAAHLRKEYEFDGEDPEADRARLKKIQLFDKLDEFIKLSKPADDNVMITIDAWDELTVSFMFKQHTLQYRGTLSQPLGQPFMINNDPAMHLITNLEINQAITAMLPKSSIIKTVISIGSFTNSYVAWYINTQLP